MSSVASIQDAFLLLHKAIMRPDFGKSHKLHKRQEQGLLPLIRTFLLGYYGHASKPEQWSKLSGSPTGWGRIDFVVRNTAVEVAVRGHDKRVRCLLPPANETEVKKLLCHDGPAVLVLFDLGEEAVSEQSLTKYRDFRPLGRGRHKTSPYWVLYISPKSKPFRFKVSNSKKTK